jgi:AbrB family looped-hinge helix DNA binding protein
LTEKFLDYVKIPKKHQITIPKRVMTELDAEEGDILEFVKQGDDVVVRKQPK